MVSALNLLDPRSIVETLGVIGVGLTLFIETGLLVGLLLPGDSLLFIAGLAASGSALESIGVQLPLPWLLLASAIGAIGGAQLGFHVGIRYGRPLFNRPEGRFFSQEKVRKAEELLMRYGIAKALILARFIPFVRTIIPPMAGVLHVREREFLFWNIVGGLIWSQSVILMGYFLGNRISGNIDQYLLPIIGCIVLISFFPLIIDYVRHRLKK